MNTIVAFIKDIFSFGGNDNSKVGLSQFKTPIKTISQEPNLINRPGEVRLSDLMRKSY